MGIVSVKLQSTVNPGCNLLVVFLIISEQGVYKRDQGTAFGENDQYSQQQHDENDGVLPVLFLLTWAYQYP
jgi:hypothetical protein